MRGFTLILTLLFGALLAGCASQPPQHNSNTPYEEGTVIGAKRVVQYERGSAIRPTAGINVSTGIKGVGISLGTLIDLAKIGSRKSEGPNEMWKMDVRLDGGRVVTVTQHYYTGEIFKAGERVKVYKYGNGLRAAH